jgi:hypothetical protein
VNDPDTGNGDITKAGISSQIAGCAPGMLHGHFHTRRASAITMVSSLIDFRAIAALFDYEPVSAAFLLFIVALTLTAACVAAYIGACSAHDLLKQKRRERMRSAALLGK